MAENTYIPEVQKFWDMQEQTIVNALQGMVAKGLLRLNDDGFYEGICHQIDMESHYIFTATENMHKNCLMAFDVLFQEFGLIPTYCQVHCWKVVIKCRNVFEMFQVYSLMRDAGIYGKAGVDGRLFTGNYYNCFAYNLSPEEAKERWIQMVDMIRDKIGGHFNDDYMKTIIVKHGCTEMEGKLPSIHWQPTDEQIEFEKKVESFIVPFSKRIYQPDWLIRYKMRRWITRAHSIGDMSYKLLEPVVGPINFGVQSITYHQEDWLSGTQDL